MLKEHLIDCLSDITSMHKRSTIGYDMGNWYDRSRTMDNGWHHFQKELTRPYCPFFDHLFLTKLLKTKSKQTQD